MEEIVNAEVLGDSDFDQDGIDSDDDLDDAIFLHLFDNEFLGNRAMLYGRFSFANISNVEAKTMFRFNKNDIPRLAVSLGIPENIQTRDNIPISGWFQCTTIQYYNVRNFLSFLAVDGLCILLRRLAYPNRLKDLEAVFGFCDRAISSISNTVMDIIYNNKGHLLQNLANVPWLNEAKLRTYSEVNIPSYKIDISIITNKLVLL